MVITTQTAHTIGRAKRWPAEIAWALVVGRSRVRWAQTWAAMSATFPVPLFLAAGWIALARFTLLDIPMWPSVLFIPAWLIWLVVWSLSRRVGDGHAARYLDHMLSLDERLTTCMELLRSSSSGRPVSDNFLEPMLFDARSALRERMPRLPGAFHFNPLRRHVIVIVVALAALAVAVMLPTPLDAVRAERSSLNKAVSGIDQTIAGLKAQIVGRPDLSDSTKQDLASELDSLESQLHQPGADRASLLAAIADTQQKVRELSPSDVSDFDSLLTAARLVQQAALGDSEWDPTSSHAPTDLGRAADAADFLGTVSAVLGTQVARSAATFLSQASDYAASRDPQLAASLTTAAGAIPVKDKQKAAQALDTAAARFRAAESALQTAQAVEGVQAKLDEGRQGLAQAGAQPAKRPQIGFRRRGSPLASDQANNPQGDPNSQPGTPQADQTASADGGTGAQSASAPPDSIGQNMAQYGNGSKAGTGQSAAPSGSNSGSNSTNGNAPGTGNGAGSPSGGASTGTGPGTGGSQGKPSDGSSGGPVAGGSGSSNGPASGTFNGAVTGASGALSGGITQVQNPQGNGAGSSGAAGQGTTGNGEKVYVPPPTQVAISGESPVNGQAAPEPNNAGGIAGRPGAGSTTGGTEGSLGAGGKAQVRTPYTEVIGKYANQATDALEQIYVPADAKEYVKEYFTELGK